MGIAIPVLIAFLTIPAYVRERPEAEDPDLEGRPITEIRIEGLRRTSRQLVLDQLKSRVGEKYSAAGLQLDRLYLDRLGIFSSIEVSASPQGAGVRLLVAVRETFPFAFYASVTSTQENGLSIGPAIGAVNLLGRAVYANAAVEFGGATNVFLSSRSPRLSRKPWWYEAGISMARRDNTLFSFLENSKEAQVRIGCQWRPNLRIAGRFRLVSLRSDRDGATLDPSGRDNVPSLSLEWRYDTRDLWTNPRSGWYVGTDLVRNWTPGGGRGWWTSQFDARRYLALGGRHGVAGFSFLAVQSGEVGRDLPQWMIYGIGGANSVRGWELGARMGKHQSLNTLEYRYQLVKVRPIRFFGYSLYWGLHLALYGDLGSAWTEPGDFSRNFIGSGGYGVRLMIPFVGMVRFDRAYGNALRPAYGLGERPDQWRYRVR